MLDGGDCIYPKYLDWQTWANSVDPYQMLQNAAYIQGLPCLPLIKQILEIRIFG